MKKYITLPIVLALSNLVLSVGAALTGHDEVAKTLFAVFVGQWIKSPRDSIHEALDAGTPAP